MVLVLMVIATVMVLVPMLGRIMPVASFFTVPVVTVVRLLLVTILRGALRAAVEVSPTVLIARVASMMLLRLRRRVMMMIIVMVRMMMIVTTVVRRMLLLLLLLLLLLMMMRVVVVAMAAVVTVVAVVTVARVVACGRLTVVPFRRCRALCSAIFFLGAFVTIRAGARPTAVVLVVQRMVAVMLVVVLFRFLQLLAVKTQSCRLVLVLLLGDRIATGRGDGGK